MSTANNILIIDDESQICKLLQIALESNNYKTNIANTAQEGIVKAANHPPDLILLDLGLPDKNGQEVLAELRNWYKSPVIILSVQKDEENIVTALDNGATDYLTKPFRTGELLARIRSALRNAILEKNEPIVVYHDLQMDLMNRVVKKNNTVIKLTSTEFNLLSLLVNNEGKVLTHQYLLKEVWGPTYVNESQYLRVFIGQLRKKIEDDFNVPKYIITESGIGYRFIGN
ncbi:MAG: response regulator [Sphingobacteriales bacterium]|nr:response regulator [Sphingobacteriales bacterium]MBP8192518.1 response regulator [Chitinophagales bacterium]